MTAQGRICFLTLPVQACVVVCLCVYIHTDIPVHLEDKLQPQVRFLRNFLHYFRDTGSSFSGL